jgi:hypothetical protein
VVCKTIYGGSNPPPTSIKSQSTKCKGFFVFPWIQLAEMKGKIKNTEAAAGSRDFIDGPPKNRITEGNPTDLNYKPYQGYSSAG